MRPPRREAFRGGVGNEKYVSVPWGVGATSVVLPQGYHSTAEQEAQREKIETGVPSELHCARDGAYDHDGGFILL